MNTCSYHLLLLIVLVLKCSDVQGQFYAQVCQATYLETLLQDDQGNFVLLDVDGHHGNNSTTSTDADDPEGDDSDWTRRLRHLRLRRKPSSLGISVHADVSSLSRKQEEEDDDSNARSLRHLNATASNTTGISMLVRRCNCEGVSETVGWFCPPTSDLCGVPFNPNDPVVCYTYSIQQAVARNAWPLVVLWYIGLVLVLLCTIPGRTCRQYVMSCFSAASNQQRVELLSNSELTPIGNNRYCQNWWTWQQRRLERRILAQAQYQWRQELNELQGPKQLELKTKIYQAEETDKEEKDPSMSLDLDPQNTTNENEIHIDDDNIAIDYDDDEEHDTSCSICLAPLQTGDRVGDLECRHVFHVDCLKTWLPRRNTCPLCQAPGVAALRYCASTSSETSATLNNSTSSRRTSRRRRRNQMRMPQPLSDIRSSDI